MNEYDTMESAGDLRSTSVLESRDLLMKLSTEFLSEAIDCEESLGRIRELEAIRRRAAIRLVPHAKMGFEHLYLSLPENS